jgi:hypothetical protein
MKVKKHDLEINRQQRREAKAAKKEAKRNNARSQR